MSKPSIAVVVPAFNSDATLKGLLESLARGDDRPDEVIVVDDGSKDPPAASHEGLDVHLVQIPHQGPVAARNAGWRAAESAWVAFLDSDCTVDEGWCRAYRCAAAQHAETAALLEGPLRETSRPAFFRHWAENVGPGRYPTANVAYRRQVLERIGGLDASFQWGRFYFREDSDLALRALKVGDAVWVPEAVALHSGRPISLGRKLTEACRYALDPGLVARHGLNAFWVDRVRIGPVVVPAPRQLSAFTVCLLAAGAVAWHVLIAPLVAVWLLRAGFVLKHEGCRRAELPPALAEQIAEPIVLVAALMAGTARVAGAALGGPRRAA